MTSEAVFSYCGFRCDLCPMYAKYSGAKADAAELNAGWRKYFGFTLPEDQIACGGCLQGKTPDEGCRIKPCASAKGIENCAACAEMETCEKLKARADAADELREKLGGVTSARDEELFITPYEGRKNLRKLRGLPG